MDLLIVSFLAGVLTVGAPCILPLLPVIVGGATLLPQGKNHRYRPLIITGSLVTSVILFTLLLKFSTSLLGIPQQLWQALSGSIVIVLGASLLWPMLWERFPGVNWLNLSSNATLSSGYKRDDVTGDVIIGAALGPIFNSCSPTYLLIVAAILPSAFVQGLVYLLAYALGLGAALLALAYGGQKLVARVGTALTKAKLFQQVIGTLFIIVGLAVLFGFDKSFQAFVLEKGWYAPLSGLEEALR